MSPGLPIWPVLAVDLAGSAAMIVLAVVALRLARRLVRRESSHVVWSFLWVLSLSLAAFSFSRGIGHIARILLVGAGRADAWQALAPLSGSINTATFMAIAGVTVFYGAVERAFLDLSATTDALRQTYKQLKDAYDALAADQARIVALERFALADRIAASLAHQTRNPIASIAGFAGILKRKCKGDQEVCANLEVISQEAAKLEQLVDGILKARHELASVFVETAPAAVAAALFEAVREKAALAGVRLWVQDSGVPGTINADVDGLVMALKEIVLNAVEVTPQGGEVIIGLKPKAAGCS
jgi:signal transduction histidine kinase